MELYDIELKIKGKDETSFKVFMYFEECKLMIFSIFKQNDLSFARIVNRKGDILFKVRDVWKG